MVDAIDAGTRRPLRDFFESILMKHLRFKNKYKLRYRQKHRREQRSDEGTNNADPRPDNTSSASQFSIYYAPLLLQEPLSRTTPTSSSQLLNVFHAALRRF
jgi:hypothetical protein